MASAETLTATLTGAPPPTLLVRDLEVEYRTERGRLRALRGVDFEVGAGRVVGLVGESGCGKSTLLSALLRLPDDPAEVVGGSILFEGRELVGLPRPEMRALLGDRMAVIFQDPTASLHPVLTIGAQMLDVQHRSAARRREKLERAAALLGRVGIADPTASLERYPHELSGGMRQRVAIAMALLSRPSLLIADEPTAALDATTKVQIIALIEELQEEIGCAVLFVSHHLGAIARLCDDVVVMYAGEVVERGEVGELFRDPRHPYTRALLECDPARELSSGAALGRPLPTIPGTVPSLHELGPGCVFAPRCREAFERCTRESPPRHRVSATRSACCHLLAEEGAAP